MSRRLDAFARELAADHTFLAAALADYARSERLDETALAAALGCSVATLTPLRLCLRPRSDARHFRADVQEIATRFAVSADVLGQAVRRSDALASFRHDPAGGSGFLMAARDRPEAERDPEGGDG
jgi:hypothetical protein